ncbi:MAG TPA: amidohydrolase family protein [Pyrinomonadaceae bacterium]|nr:amidohydrolase family protein [Pyrinomonadaceae bacterium]
MIATLRLILSLFLLSTLTLAQRPQARPPIIDVHMHAHAADRFGKIGIPNPVTGTPSAAITDDALLKAALAAMRRYNIVKAFASSRLDSVERWRVAAPSLFVGGAQIDQGITVPEAGQLQQDFLSGHLGFMGEIGAQYLGLSPTDSTLEPYFALAEELDIPVAIHTGISSPNTPYECCPKFRTSLGNPMLLEEVLIRHPKLRVNLMHAGYPYLQDTIAIMSVYPQVYADLGAIDWIIPRAEFHAYLQALMRAGFGKRLMFGSDQMIWPEAIGMAIEGINSARFLTYQQRRDIFYNNAVRFFRLEDKQLRRTSFRLNAPSNNSFNRSGNSAAFIRET